MLKTTAENKTDGLQQENPFFFSCSLSLALISDAPGMLLTREFVMEGCLRVNGLFSRGYGSLSLFFNPREKWKAKPVRIEISLCGVSSCAITPYVQRHLVLAGFESEIKATRATMLSCKNQALFILHLSLQSSVSSSSFDACFWEPAEMKSSIHGFCA